MTQVISDKAAQGLVFLSRMRLTTIEQFARAASISTRHAGYFLHSQRLLGRLGICGGVPLGGVGRAPKAYFLTQKGWEYYTSEEGEGLPLETYKNAKPAAVWSRGMAHRLTTVSLVQDIGIGLRSTEQGVIMGARFDFKTAEYLGKTRKETTDFISGEISTKTALVPDATLWIQRRDGRNGLAFIETDMGTEAITGTGSTATTIEEKLGKYEQYYRSGRFQKRYEAWADFKGFMVLLVTSTEKRVSNIAKLLPEMDRDLDALFLLASHQKVREDPLGNIWTRRGHAGGAPVNILGV